MGKIERFSKACLLAALLTTCALLQGLRPTLADTPDRGARLGVTGERLDDAWRERENYWSNGILVTELAPGGAAERIGIQPGDVLVSVGSQILKSPDDLAEAERDLEPGRPVSMVVARNGGRWIRILNADPDPLAEPEAVAPVSPESEAAPPEIRVPATEPLAVVSEDRGAESDDDAADADADDGEESDAVPVPPVSSAPRTEAFGARCQSMNAGLAAALGIADPRGLLVLEVTKGGLADGAGIRAGDVISRVADLEVGDPGKLSYALETCPRITSIRTWRQGAVREAKVTFPTRKALAAARKAAAVPPVETPQALGVTPPSPAPETVAEPAPESEKAIEPERVAEPEKVAEREKADEPATLVEPEKAGEPEAAPEASVLPKADAGAAKDAVAPEDASNRELERMIRDMREELIQLRSQVRKLRAELEHLKQI